jgi:hypothetical protein
LKSKFQQIREAWAAHDQIGALRIAAHFHDQSADTITFKRGYDAYNNRRFYQQLGKDPVHLIASALSLLQTKFSLDQTSSDFINSPSDANSRSGQRLE